MMKRGEVYWADLRPRSGSEQRGRRPVVLVSNDGFNQVPNWRSVIVVPLSTSRSQASRGPTVVALPAAAGALSADSLALCHQVTTLDRAKLGRRLGALSVDELRRVGEGLKLAMELN